MSTYSNRLQPSFQNLLQHVVQFFHPRLSCTTHISVDVFNGRKSLIKPVTWQKTGNYIGYMHDDAYIGGCSENNIKCVVHDDLGWKNQTTRYILPRHWLYEWLSRLYSFIVVELIRFFHGALQLQMVMVECAVIGRTCTVPASQACLTRVTACHWTSIKTRVSSTC